MYQPYNSADVLLQKASLHLREKWPSAEQDDLQDYLSSLNRKNMNSVKFKDMSDISMSSDDVEIEFAKSSSDEEEEEDDDNDWRKTKSFKQPTHFDMPQPKTIPNSPFIMSSTFPEKGPASSMLRPASRGGISVPLTGGRSVSQTSSALDRASALVQKLERRVSGVEPRPKSGMRISFNIESDEDSRGDLTNKENSDDSNSEVNFRRSGQRFLKKPQPEEPAETKDNIQDACEKPKPEKIPDLVFERRNSLMFSTSIVLSSDDESMAEFIGKLSLPDSLPVPKDHISQQSGRLSRNSSMERKPSILKRSPSPRQIHSPSPSLRNQSSRSPSPAFAARTVKHLHSVTEDLTLAESLPGEIVEEEPVEEEEADHSKSTEKDMKLNLFSVEDLRSSFRESGKKNKMEKTQKEKEKLPRIKSHHSKLSRHSSRKSSQHSSRHSSRHSSKPSSRNSSDKSITEEIHSKEHKIFSSFGLQTIEDLLPRTQLLSGQHRSVSFDTGSLKVTSSCHEESVTEVVSEIHTQRSVTPSGRKHSSHSSVADAYSEDFTSANVSESDRNVCTEDFHTVSDMGTSTLSHDTFLSASNTEMSSHESSKQKIRSRKSRRRTRRPKVVRVCNEGTQTNELDFIQDKLQASPWNSFYAHQDWKGRPLMTGTTKPVISATPHMCDHGCLNAHLPSQSNLVAVHEIMKQQLEFTRQFCESQKYLYHSLVEALAPDYVYTTLEDTKEYIKKHRKPKLTMKKALEMVELEMQTS